MATKNNPGPYDCFANAGPDEPLFILLGRDRHAPALVWLWSALRELEEEDPAKVLNALSCARDMLAELRGRGKAPAPVGKVLLAGLAVLLGEDPAGRAALSGTFLESSALKG